MTSITGAFSSLCISERAGTPLENSSSARKLVKNRSTISLPNMDFTERPISSQFIKTVCDDEIEQPVDFSKKYCETKSLQIDNKIIENGNRTFSNVVKSYNNSFTIYAETDLDQPTDYSLRYAEDDSDSDRCNKIPKTETTEFVQDTVKTYCTEDTPYETPFNFSTATSMSDLRIDDKPPENKLDVPIQKTVINSKGITHRDKIKSEFSSGLMSPEKPVNYCEEGTPGYFSRVPSCGSLNSIPATDPPKPESVKKELRRTETKVVKFEEVVNYAEETPLMFSRSSSLGSLDSIEQHSIHDDRSSVVSDFSRLTSGIISPSELPDSPSQTVPPSPRPRKTHSFPLPKKKPAQTAPKPSIFEDSVQKFKLESTPLHFSTATSLSSLVDDEVDSKVPNNEAGLQVKNENLNDHLSEEDEELLAACINLGMQGNRYNPQKSEEEETPAYRFSNSEGNLNNSRHSAVPVITFKPPEKADVTSDSVRTYCTEGTPAALSHAGSNSDLSILSMHLNEKLAMSETQSGRDELRELEVPSGEDDQKSASDIENQNDDLNVSLDHELQRSNQLRRSSISSLSESEEALLEKCILDGMAKSPSPAIENKVTPDVPKVKVADLSSDEETEDILGDCIKMGIDNKRYSRPRHNVAPPKFSSNDMADDVVKSFCTEDTPAVLSHAGSCSNLSILSLQGNDTENRDYFSDNTNLSEEEEKLLEECIKLGMGAVAEEKSNGKRGSKVRTRKSAEKHDKKVPNYPHPDTGPALDSSLSEDEEALLQRCIEAGMSAHAPQDLDSAEEDLLQKCIAAGMSKADESAGDLDSEEEELLQKCIEAGMGRHAPKPKADESSDLSSGEEALLQHCIRAGMSAPKPRPLEESSDLSSGEEELLQRCIQAGMPKAPPKTGRDKSTALTPTQKAVLQQCIVDGMKKYKKRDDGARRVSKGRSGAQVGRETTELSESERLLLQQCILAGMPKRSRPAVGREGKEWARRSKDGGAEHTCCIHCPRNRAVKQANGQSKGRRRYRERGVQVRESRDVSVVYVASQILVRKEVVGRTHEKWV